MLQTEESVFLTLFKKCWKKIFEIFCTFSKVLEKYLIFSLYFRKKRVEREFDFFLFVTYAPPYKGLKNARKRRKNQSFFPTLFGNVRKEIKIFPTLFEKSAIEFKYSSVTFGKNFRRKFAFFLPVTYGLS